MTPTRTCEGQLELPFPTTVSREDLFLYAESLRLKYACRRWLGMEKAQVWRRATDAERAAMVADRATGYMDLRDLANLRFAEAMGGLIQ